VKISIVCFGAMRDYLPSTATGNRADLDIPQGGTARDAVDAIAAPQSLVFALLIDGEQGTLDQVLPEGAELTLMPPFAGGTE
jgi:hypothetical protein